MKVLYLYSVCYCEWSFDQVKKLLDTGNCELLRMDIITPLKLKELVDQYDCIVLVATHNDCDITHVDSIFYSYPEIDLPLDKLLILDVTGCENENNHNGAEASFGYPCYKVDLDMKRDGYPYVIYHDYPHVVYHDNTKVYLCEGFLASTLPSKDYIDQELSELIKKIVNSDNLILSEVKNKFVEKSKATPKNKLKTNVLL